MAQRRMFSPDIVDSDAFLDMSPSAQNLYFHLGMRADDDGFVGNPKKILRVIGSNDDDLKLLIAKRFILLFQSGVVVIKHWLIHNLIRADLYKETSYKDEKSTLGLNENGAYTELRPGVFELKQIETPEWLKRRRKELRTANVPNTALRLGKDRLGKDRLDNSSTDLESVPQKDVPALRPATPTPKETAREFFTDITKQEAVVQSLAEKGLPANGVRAEVMKFVSYWRELNATGKKERWEMQKTFEVQRRLVTWFNKAFEFQGKNQIKRVRVS